MPTKTTKDGRPYEIDGKRFTWHPEDDDGERGNMPDVVIPLRMKLGVVLDIAEQAETVNNTVMVQMLAALLPGEHMETVREMDVNDFQDMFSAWQNEYNTLTGATLGESSASAG